MNFIGGADSFRYFKIISVNNKKVKDEGRYKTKGSPGDAAKKAFTQLSKKYKTNKLIFSIKETTQGSSKKEHGPYLGEKIKLKKPLQVKYEGKNKPVIIKYETKIHLVKDHKQKGGIHNENNIHRLTKLAPDRDRQAAINALNKFNGNYNKAANFIMKEREGGAGGGGAGGGGAGGGRSGGSGAGGSGRNSLDNEDNNQLQRAFAMSLGQELNNNNNNNNNSNANNNLNANYYNYNVNLDSLNDKIYLDTTKSIPFLLTLNLSESILPLNGKNLNFIRFTVSPHINELRNYDCCLNEISTGFNEIYLTFKPLDGNKLYNITRELLLPYSSMKKKEPINKVLIKKLVTYINSKNQEPINIYSSEFILETQMFLHRNFDVCEKFTNLIMNEKTRVLHHIIHDSIFHPPNDVEKPKIGDKIVSLRGFSDKRQKDSYYFDFLHPGLDNTNINAGSSNKYKIHISIKPEFTNLAIQLIIRYVTFIIGMSKHRKLSEKPKDYLYQILSNSVTNQQKATYRKMFEKHKSRLIPEIRGFCNEETGILPEFFCQMKIQNPSPVHLYELPDWDGWEQVINDHPGGVGYIVIYPSIYVDYDDGEIFTTCITHFENFWRTNFEQIYPAAKRDGNYIPFNERISDTIYFAYGSDTSSKLIAMEDENQTKFKASDKIYSYIQEYCNEERSNNSKQQISECLSNKFNINNIDCQNIKKFPWNPVDVWLPNFSDELHLAECDIPQN